MARRNVVVGFTVNQQYGSTAAPKSIQRRGLPEIDTVPDAGVSETELREGPAHRPRRNAVLRQTVLRDLLERGERTIGDQGSEARLACSSLEQYRGAHRLA